MDLDFFFENCTISVQVSLEFGKNQDKLFYSLTQCRINSNYVRVRCSTPYKYGAVHNILIEKLRGAKTLNVKSF